jgi:hypothetical protein
MAKHTPLLRAVVVLLAIACVTPARAEEQYYVVVFGSQTRTYQPRLAHSFATFVKVDGPPGACTFEAHTISWLPETLEVRVWRVRPEPGDNLDLPTTLRVCAEQGAKVVRWGPYPIDPELYHRAMNQIASLDSDSLRYKAVDTGYSTNVASNCIHAIADLAGRGRLRIASPGWGHFASWACVSKLRPWLLDTTGDYEWVAEALGLHECPIEHRDFNVNPRTSLSREKCHLPALLRPWKP